MFIETKRKCDGINFIQLYAANFMPLFSSLFSNKVNFQIFCKNETLFQCFSAEILYSPILERELKYRSEFFMSLPSGRQSGGESITLPVQKCYFFIARLVNKYQDKSQRQCLSLPLNIFCKIFYFYFLFFDLF